MSPFRAFLAAMLLALGFASTQPALAQSSTTPPSGPITTPPGGPIIALPELVVTSVTASATCTSKGTVTVNIEATVKNQGVAIANLKTIAWQIILSAQWWAQSNNQWLEKNPPPQTVEPFIGKPETLAPGESWKGHMTIVGITKYVTKKGNTVPGNYVIQARADPYKGVPESNEKNNDTRTTVADPCFKLAR
ncbi:MAG: hypothetical protein C0484_12915 [Rhodospirillum sp.]|nr:hypothetical protein [Rhodospirillum sp.]